MVEAPDLTVDDVIESRARQRYWEVEYRRIERLVDSWDSLGNIPAALAAFIVSRLTWNLDQDIEMMVAWLAPTHLDSVRAARSRPSWLEALARRDPHLALRIMLGARLLAKGNFSYHRYEDPCTEEDWDETVGQDGETEEDLLAADDRHAARHAAEVTAHVANVRALVGGWHSLAETSAEAANTLAQDLAGNALAAERALDRLAPGWRDALAAEHGHDVDLLGDHAAWWGLQLIAEQNPLIALKVGVEAALRDEIEECDEPGGPDLLPSLDTRRIQWVWEVVESWQRLAATPPELAAFIAVTVAHTPPLATVPSPLEAGAPWPGASESPDAPPTVERCVDELLAWQHWLRAVTLASPLGGLKVALDAALRYELSLSTPEDPDDADVPCLEATLASLCQWTELATPPPDAVRWLFTTLWIAAGDHALETVLPRLAPDWWHRLERAPNISVVCFDHPVLQQLTLEQPLLALQIGVAANLLHEIDDCLLSWGAHLLDWWSTQANLPSQPT
ncbi:MAG TPA: hypothetical protein VFN74_25650, partial [Chloroflexota bacterium]|nr:hypothetical protein [Chloroflexota bacterium]